MFKIKAAAVFLSSCLIIACSNTNNIKSHQNDDISYAEMKKYTQEERIKNLRDQSDNLEEGDSFNRVLNEKPFDKNKLEYVILSLMKDVVVEEGYFYQIFCYKEALVNESCISAKIKLPTEQEKYYQDSKNKITINRYNNRITVNTSYRFEGVELETVYIEKSDVSLPVSKEIHDSFVFNTDKKEQEKLSVLPNGFMFYKLIL